MRRPRKLWVALGLFWFLLMAFVGIILWGQYGYSHTIIIYEAVGEQVVRETLDSTAAEEATARETAAATAGKLPSWTRPARWGTLSAALVIAGYFLYVEVSHRRKQRVSSLRQ